MTEDEFELPVTYKGKALSFTARLIQGRYSYKIEFLVGEIHVNFERDEEGLWRVLLSENDLQKHDSVDKGLIEAIMESIDQVLSD